MKRGFALALALSTWAAAGAAPMPVAPTPLTEQDIGGRLRVFAVPGDYKLTNLHVTAVIRRSDGWLTEFWQNRPRLPTVEQLGTITEIDGLWQLYPVVYVAKDKTAYPVLADRVRMLPDGIETEGLARVKEITFLALTTYRLEPSSSRLRMSTTFSVVGGARSAALGFGDAVKWGNVSYFVDGVQPPRSSYKGPARWVGRRGAGGDLLLRPTAGAPMWVEYAARIRGFQGTIHALYKRSAIPENGTLTVSRELAYETLPLPRAPPPTPKASLHLRVVDEALAPLPAKVRVDRIGQNEPVFSDDGGLDGADRFLWTGNGEIERTLEPGTYRLLVTSGIERDARRFDIVLRAGEHSSLEARLPRVITSPGWISADLHLHQAPSVDADVSLPARVISIAAEGIEFAVATDHYVVTDLGPTLRWLREKGVLSRPLQTMPGTEVSTLGHRFGHFNVFPMRLDSNVKFENTTVNELFADARRKAKDGVLQVNHPRWEAHLGYFTYFGIDDKTGQMSLPGFNPHFDTLEVYNGDDAWDLKAVRRVFTDWLHLLGTGQRWTATGSSDSHKLAFLDPGLPRTMIHHGSARTDDTDVNAAAKDILRALKSGRALVTSGPFIDAHIHGKGPGESVRGVGTVAKLDVIVRAAPWIDVSTLEVYVGGSGEKHYLSPVPRSQAVLRLERSYDIPISERTFVVVAAQGERELPNASRSKTLPFAFTNPIWVEP